MAGVIMTTREQLIETGAQALVGGTSYAMGGDPPGFPGAMNRLIASFVIDAVEKIIRADERRRVLDALEEQVHIPVVWVKEAEVRAQLREQVKALPHTWNCPAEAFYTYGPGDERRVSTGQPCLCPIATVLALLEEIPDE